MLRRLLIAIATMLSLVAGSSAMQQPPASAAPKTVGTTPARCLQEVRDYIKKRQQEVTAATSTQQRPPLIAQIDKEKSAMAAECAERLDNRSLAEIYLRDLAELYTEAGQTEKASATAVRAVAAKGLSQMDRAGVLVFAIRAGLKEPKSDERNARLEKYVDELDRFPAALLEYKLDAHAQMNSWYRYDDIDSGIIKHSTWIIDTSKAMTPDQRKKAPFVIGNAYINLAEALAGQGQNDRALTLLAAAGSAMADTPNMLRAVDAETTRLKLVDTPAPALTAPNWLNMPPDTRDLPMPGSVTLLEFSAHWCTPCKESYPGVNRLRARYGSKGFRVVLATQLYGYFESERNLTAEAEIEHDRKYFAEHSMNVPIAIADNSNPNNKNYEVGGIPQIHLIDKKGQIRLVMVGYDDANEDKLGKMIEDLIKEK